MPIFVDTNVFVYARDVSAGEKHLRARHWVNELWRARAGRVSMQVLHEYYVTVTRKLSPGLPPPEARRDVRDLMLWRPVPLEGPLAEAAWSIEDRYRLSFWDALVVAAARRAGCERLLSEDLQGGQDFEGTIVINPFLHGPDDLDLS